MSARKALGACLESALELLYPHSANCLGCDSTLGADEGWLCDECNARLLPLARLSLRRCPRCGCPLHGAKACKLCADWPEDIISFARYAHFYHRPVRRMIAHLKYGGTYALGEWMGVQLSNACIAERFDAPDLIVPVPMHKRRLLERGFNHASLLARALSGHIGVPSDDACLVRTRDTRQQAKIEKSRRGHSLSGAFLATDRVNGKKILLVDDVLTTGETACRAAEALRLAGATDVQVIALAGPGGGQGE